MSETIGQQLAAARIAQGLEIEDVAHKTRIHRDVLCRLESDEFDQFPNTMFVKSFLKIYSDYLGIDPSPAIEQVSARVDHRSHQYLLGGISPMVRERFGSLASRIPMRPILATAAALVLISVGGSYLVSHLYGSPAIANKQIEKPTAQEPAEAAPEIAVENPTEPVSNPDTALVPKTMPAAPTGDQLAEREPVDPNLIPKAAPVVRIAEPVEAEADESDGTEEKFEPYEVTPGVGSAEDE